MTCKIFIAPNSPIFQIRLAEKRQGEKEHKRLQSVMRFTQTQLILLNHKIVIPYKNRLFFFFFFSVLRLLNEQWIFLKEVKISDLSSCFWQGTRFINFSNFLNKKHPSINFTIEKKAYHSLAFPDAFISGKIDALMAIVTLYQEYFDIDFIN